MKIIYILLLPFVFGASLSYAQFSFPKSLNDAKKDLSSAEGKKQGGLSSEEVAKGLKDALSVGANNAGASASKTDGFFKDSLIKIHFPPDAEKVKNTALKLGMQKQVDDFVLSMNRAAEKASVKAAPVFVNAITSMNIDDAMKILNGPDNAATQYLQGKTQQQLHDDFLPIVKSACDSVEVTKYWTPLANAYNKTTFFTGDPKVNTDLNEYVTQQALKGLFVLLAGEELKIRKNPAARVDDLLKKVFGSLDNKQ
jgi:hypothetical protein